VESEPSYVTPGQAVLCHCETSLKHLGKARDIREVLGVLEKADMTLVFKKGRKEDLESCRLVSLAREGVMASHPAAISSVFEGQERDCRTLAGGKRRRSLYLDIRKAFAGVSHSLLTDRLLTAAQKKWSMWWMGSWLNHEGQMSSMVQSPPDSHCLMASLEVQAPHGRRGYSMCSGRFGRQIS